MESKWLISIRPSSEKIASVNREKVTKIHGPFAFVAALREACGTIAADLGYPDELEFAAFEIVDNRPQLIYE
jgi:hypothetical protein